MNTTNITRNRRSWGLAALALILALAVMGIWAHQSVGQAEASGGTVSVQDVDGDGIVGFAELMALLQCYNQQNVGNTDCSLSDSWPETLDGTIDFNDFLMVLKFYGQEAAPPPPES